MAEALWTHTVLRRIMCNGPQGHGEYSSCACTWEKCKGAKSIHSQFPACVVVVPTMTGKNFEAGSLTERVVAVAPQLCNPKTGATWRPKNSPSRPHPSMPWLLTWSHLRSDHVGHHSRDQLLRRLNRPRPLVGRLDQRRQDHDLHHRRAIGPAEPERGRLGEDHDPRRRRALHDLDDVPPALGVVVRAGRPRAKGAAKRLGRRRDGLVAPLEEETVLGRVGTEVGAQDSPKRQGFRVRYLAPSAWLRWGTEAARDVPGFVPLLDLVEAITWGKAV